MTKTELIEILESEEKETVEENGEQKEVLKSDIFLKTINKRIAEEKKLIYPEGLRIVERFLGALFTDQMIILSGPPGTGKTSLPFAIADVIGAEKPILIPVQPNWTDNQDLMGYYNPVKNNNAGGYTTTPFLDAILKALQPENRDKLFFVVLDEMNLAHIEYYFSTMLSIMESEDKIIRLYSERLQTENCEVPSEIVLPDNLQIIGTLNMDETTKGISPKVIDRSYILEIPGEIGKDKDLDKEDKVLKVHDYPDEKFREWIKEELELTPSFRLLSHYDLMKNRRFMDVDDFVVGKILPMIHDKNYESIPVLVDCKISNEKIDRMTVQQDENGVKLDFWGTD